MSYRKLKADYLFDGFKMQKNRVLICTKDGTIETIVDEDQAGRRNRKFFRHSKSRDSSIVIAIWN